MLDEIWRILDGGATEGLFAPQGVILSLLLAFVLGQMIA